MATQGVMDTGSILGRAGIRCLARIVHSRRSRAPGVGLLLAYGRGADVACGVQECISCSSQGAEAAGWSNSMARRRGRAVKGTNQGNCIDHAGSTVPARLTGRDYMAPCKPQIPRPLTEA